MRCPICHGQTIYGIHPKCRPEVPEVAADLRRSIIDATTTRLDRGVHLIRQPMPGQTWGGLMGTEPTP